MSASSFAEQCSNPEDVLSLLRECHNFPCTYAFKVIGPNTLEWSQAILLAARSVLGNSEIEWSARPSKAQADGGEGSYQAITLSSLIEHADAVLAVYAALRRVSGLKMLL